MFTVGNTIVGLKFSTAVILVKMMCPLISKNRLSSFAKRFAVVSWHLNSIEVTKIVVLVVKG